MVATESAASAPPPVAAAPASRGEGPAKISAEQWRAVPDLPLRRIWAVSTELRSVLDIPPTASLASDVDGDGVPDVWLGTAGTLTRPPRVELVSPGTGRRLACLED